LARGKSPKISVLEAESSRRRHDSTSFLEKVIFSKIWPYHTPEPRYLTAVELKDPRPAPPQSGGLKERLRPLAHINPGHEKGLLARKGDSSNSLAKTEASQKLQIITDLNSEIDLLWGDLQNHFFFDDIMP
jgi:hypothetical protein